MRRCEADAAALTVVGASVRAVAESARRAGWAVHAADLFCDLDLRRAAVEAVRAAPYPAGLPEIVSGFPPGPWLYTGALENHPHVLDALAALRPLAGNGSAAVRAVRDVARLAAVVRASGLQAPETRFDPRDVPTDGTFLVKPRAGAGGRGIRRWHGSDPAVDDGAPSIWQRHVVGDSWSAAFVAGGGRCRLLGVSRQLTAATWCHAQGFAYCGSVAMSPAYLPDETRADFDRLGDVLAGDFQLMGLVGADVIVDGRQRIHVLEVNPRPTASMELVERGSGESLVAAHLAACGVGPSATAPAASAPLPGTWAKAVMFAASDLRPDGARLERLARDWSAADGAAALADIPSPGTSVAAGTPLLTLFARARATDDAIHLLRCRAAAVDALLAGESFSRPDDAADAPRPRRRGRTA
jgi:predicted ATP-grasp superfamily ATP-dependent carboligase